MNYNEFDELYLKINEKFNSDNVINDGDEISTYTLNLALNCGMLYYNYALISEIEKKVELINKKINILNFFKMKNSLPYINKICPGINDTENKYIEVFFKNSSFNRNIGKAIIDEKIDIKLDYFSEEYDKERILKFLKEYQNIYESILYTLDIFKEQYPNTPYQWNNEYKSSKEIIDDGFNTIYFNLDNVDNPIVSFSNKRDIEISRIYTKKYGELYDYIEYYKTEITRKIKVNINNLNPLYQTIVRKQMELYGDFTKNVVINKTKRKEITK